MIYFQHRAVMWPVWTKALFSWSVICRNLPDQSRLTQDFSHNYVAVVTRATIGWVQKMYLKKTALFNRYSFYPLSRYILVLLHSIMKILS